MNKIVKAIPLPDGHLQVVMQDGRCGEFDVKPFMASDFFAALKDENYFQKVHLFFAGVGWPEGQDLGPDTVAAGLKVLDEVKPTS
ncbi:MAG: DUF2442 domain-containing protein [Sulfuricella sp.]